MKSSLFYILLLTSLVTNAQTTPYQAFEVDSAAEPRGGVVFFNTFVQATLRKPVPAQAAGTGGHIVVEGVVEPNGRVSNVKALQSLRPDLDREAVRVFSLFNAWKPAKKNGQTVRQRVTMPIVFQPNTPFTYVNGNWITYFNADSKVVADSAQAKYKQAAPIDINGVPTGDVVVYELKSKGWKESFRMPLIRRKNSTNATQAVNYTVGVQNYKQDWAGEFFIVDEAGTVLEQSFYRDGKRVGTEMRFHPNGAIAEKSDEGDDAIDIMNWYSDGQIRQIRSVPKFNSSMPNRPQQVTSLWDSQGNPLVKDGNGRAIYETTVTSRVDTAKQTQLVEKGRYENGFKQDIWMGHYADGSYFYEEQYDKGICQSGKAWSAGRDTVRYQAVEQQPEFKGGMQALGQFLAQNLRYPVDAQRSRTQGRVFISFVINTNGSVDDVQVLKGIGYGADEEATRVVKATNGRWKPGIQRGEKVRVKYNLPINFTLQ